MLLEGLHSFPPRILAAQQWHGLDADPIYFYPNDLNLLRAESVRELSDYASQIDGLALVAIDTFAKATPGADENSAKDMGLAMKAAETISRDLGCFVLLVHHYGKDTTRGLRGSSSLGSAADTVLEVTRAGEGLSLRCGKQKSGPDGMTLNFRMEKVSPVHPRTGEVLPETLVCQPTAIEALTLPDAIRAAVGEQPGMTRNELRCFGLVFRFCETKRVSADSFRTTLNRLKSSSEVVENEAGQLYLKDDADGASA